MARLFGIRGPAVDYALTGTATLIPGFTVTTTFGSGPLLLMWQGRYTPPGALSTPTINFRINGGSQLNTNQAQEAIAAGTGPDLTRFCLATAQNGPATIEVFAHNASVNGGTLVNGCCWLILMELPDWMDPDRLTFLA